MCDWSLRYEHTHSDIHPTSLINNQLLLTVLKHDQPSSTVINHSQPWYDQAWVIINFRSIIVKPWANHHQPWVIYGSHGSTIAMNHNAADSAGTDLNLFWGFELYHHDDLTFDPQRPKGAFNSYTAFRQGLPSAGAICCEILGMLLYESGILG